MSNQPETYVVQRTRFAPNNERYPVHVYRNCLPLPLCEENTTRFLESHDWIKKGSWGHIPIRHFHPNTHECYGAFSGKSTMLIGCGTSDTSGGTQIRLEAGDVIVLPAGTAHCNLESTEDYKYIGVYPKGAPRWRNEIGRHAVDHDKLRIEIDAVVEPSQDPIYGRNGPLMKLWVHPNKHSKL